MKNITSVISKSTFNSQKKVMFYMVTGSLFLIAGIQSVNAATCAPDVKYLLPKLSTESAKNEVLNITVNKYNDGYIDALKDDLHTLERAKSEANGQAVIDSYSDQILYEKELMKQLECRRDGGQVASSSADFDANGNFKGSTQQASNKKYKSGKNNNQELVATAESNANGTNSNDSNNAESSDSKSKGKEFAKDEKRLHANSCVSVIRKNNQGSAFKNICPYPIEVVWCSNSKEDPNQCDRGWYGQWSFGVGHSEPINATNETTHWVVSACKGENSLFMNDEMKRNKKVRCVKWDN